MSERTFGRGTWYDKMASRIIERETKLGRNLESLTTEMGLGASGFPHIGSLGDAVRSFAVSLGLRDQGFHSELIAFCDDTDGLRKVPYGLPKSLENYIGFPVSDIPDPLSCHESYGKHMSSLLLEALDKCGIEYHYVSAKETYEKGLLNEEIRTLLLNAQNVGEIVKEEVGQERYTEVLPYFATCASCGRIYTTKAFQFLPKENKILYTCEGMEIRGKQLKGCGFNGEADVMKGQGKLSWKGEFAARWRRFDVRFEAFGKDIADSVRINDRISREILKFEPPSHARYEMFLDRSGRKISKSTGNAFTPQVWFRYGSKTALLLLMLKRFVGARTLDVKDIPSYMDEFDTLEDLYFGKKKIKEEREEKKLRGLYEYCCLLKPPSRPSTHVPYNLVVFLVKMAPRNREEPFILEKLQTYGYVKPGQTLDEDLKERIEFACNWVQDFEEINRKRVSLTLQQKKAIEELIEIMSKEIDTDQVQNAVFRIARKSGLAPSDFFRIIYMILLGTPQGPRLGPYVLTMGKDSVAKSLKHALEN